MDFVCPKCGGELFALPGMKKCVGGHCFDRAREGYYNLLLGVGGGVHGDNKMMLDARRKFLSSGAYGPLCDLLAKTVMGLLPRGGSVLDAGCGEGYYTDAVERALRERDGESNVLALDISKDGVRIAAKRNHAVSYAVASSYAMPVADGSVDVIMNVFRPWPRTRSGARLRPTAPSSWSIPTADICGSLNPSCTKLPTRISRRTPLPMASSALATSIWATR